MGLRVNAQNDNAMRLARFLSDHKAVDKVYYPGLPSHPGHQLAKEQMHGFGGMVSFELTESIDASAFLKNLTLIKPSMSLAGIESTVISPHLASHSLLSPEEREAVGISDQLIRLSVGIEEVKDLKKDINKTINKLLKKQEVTL